MVLNSPLGQAFRRNCVDDGPSLSSGGADASSLTSHFPGECHGLELSFGFSIIFICTVGFCVHSYLLLLHFVFLFIRYFLIAAFSLIEHIIVSLLFYFVYINKKNIS